MPKMGQTLAEATVLTWLKNEGETVEGWEEVVQVMTDKTDMGVEPCISGTILKILAEPGSVVPLGGAMAIIGKPGEDISALLKEGDNGAPQQTQPAEAPSTAAAGPSSTGTPAGAPAWQAGELPSVTPRAREAASAAGLNWRELNLTGTGAGGAVTENDLLAYLEQRPAASRPTPLAAKLAADLGVDPSSLAGTGPGGRTTAGDVRRAVPAAAPAPLIEARRIPLSGMRRVVAQRLAASWNGAPHVPLRTRVDMSACALLRSQLKPAMQKLGARLTYTDLLVAAIARTLVDHPLLNATLEEESIVVHPSVNLGIAVALDEGLIVPVLRGAESLSFVELSRSVGELTSAARSGSLPLDAFQNGTITLTNLGQFGVESFDPILNPPQVAIIGAGSIRDEVCAVDGRVEVRPVMGLNLTFDHRALDGAPAAQFLQDLCDLLQNPVRLLLP